MIFFEPIKKRNCNWRHIRLSLSINSIFDTPNSTPTLLFMCCTLDYDKLLLCKFKGSAYREVIFVLWEKLGIKSLCDIVSVLYFRRFQMKAAWKHMNYVFVSHEFDFRWRVEVFTHLSIKKKKLKKKKKTISLFMINIDRLSLSVIITVYNCCNDWVHFL